MSAVGFVEQLEARFSRFPTSAEPSSTQLPGLESEFGRHSGNTDWGCYRPLRAIGRGSMGKVLLAKHRVTGFPYALKVPHSAEAMDRQAELYRLTFKNEITAAARLKSHPHIVRVHDVVLTPTSRFLVMDYIPNALTVKKLLASRRELSLATILRLIWGCARALGYVHESGIVHRDIKPSNIMLSPQGDARIADFGIAQFDVDVLRGNEVIIAGSPKYMSPEQIAQIPLNGQSDLFSLGIVMLELLLGEHPFNDATVEKIQFKILTAAYPNCLNRWGDKLGEGLNQVLARLLAKDRSQRYRTAFDLAADIEVLSCTLSREAQRQAALS